MCDICKIFTNIIIYDSPITLEEFGFFVLYLKTRFIDKINDNIFRIKILHSNKFIPLHFKMFEFF